jgi:AAA family ATP:ADP antiporter
MAERSPDDRTPVERLLRVVTDVRSGEGPLSLTLALNVFLFLTAYYIIKPVREALILPLASGPEIKIYLSAAIALALVFAVPAYARFVDRLPRLRLVVGVTLFFASHLVLFFAASQYEPFRRNLGPVFFVWVGVFNMMVVAQLWSFANDLFDSEQGKRLFPLVALGATLGAAFGSKIAGWLVEPLGVYVLLLVGASVLAVCAVLFVVSERLSVALRRRGPGPAPAAANASILPREPPNEPRRGAFGLVVGNRYLLAIALFSLVFSWANTNGEYMLGKLVRAAADEAVLRGALAPEGVKAFIGHAFADFYLAVNLLCVALQAFVVSRIVRYGATGPALFVLPFITLASGLAVFAVPVLAVLQVGKTLENGTDYSLNNTVRQMLWLPTSREMKYKAKQAVDTFFVRLGDVSSAGLVLCAGLFSWSVRAFALTNVLLSAAWLFFAWRIRREGARLEREAGATPGRGVTTDAATT